MTPINDINTQGGTQVTVVEAHLEDNTGFEKNHL